MNAPAAVRPVLKLVTDVSAAGAGTLPVGAHSTAAHNKHPDRSGKRQGSSPAAPSGAQGHLKRSIIYDFYGTAAPMSNGEAAENMRIAFQARRFKLKSGKNPGLIVFLLEVAGSHLCCHTWFQRGCYSLAVQTERRSPPAAELGHGG